ncbi:MULTISPECIES: ABC transporter permease [Oceanibaculum]|uniref:ABC transporter inner membrane protein n=1 Tax=Oceanibaculum indicum P24 TaxID=1207063 RepID=K2JWH7_9PROT|nr:MULTISPECIES: ABC transporter permease [Oceanibaculum]EKE78967.1 ABC transporter inner membrane protein [Oceanibaculum indicum P24]MCH2394677.1 ABC transporter permease [Oceanibaculum sp.]
MSDKRDNFLLAMLLAPALLVFCAFFLLPIGRLALAAGTGPDGLSAYAAILTNPRYRESLIATVLLSAGVTLATLVLCAVCGLFLERNRFPGRAVLIGIMTLPLSFPGVVVGFLVIMLAGRQGLIGDLTQALSGSKLVFAYSMAGLFLGYLYFSIPRVILTVMASAGKLDRRLEEAARSLGASTFAVTRDVILPGLLPALLSSGAICFATSMGAFGTAFTLATNIDVLPMVIYTEFTLHANIAMAAALSLILGLITWAVLALARTAAGSSVAAAG